LSNEPQVLISGLELQEWTCWKFDTN